MRIRWEDIQISGKELLAVIVFIFSMSGIYYKLFYDKDMSEKVFQSYMKTNDARIDLMEANQKTQNQIFHEQLRILSDDYKERKAIEKYQKENFQPLKRVN